MYAAVLIERRMIGAGLVAFVLLGLAVAQLTERRSSWHRRSPRPSHVSLQILVVNAVLSTFGALGIHLLVFEDMTYELRADEPPARGGARGAAAGGASPIR